MARNNGQSDTDNTLALSFWAHETSREYQVLHLSVVEMQPDGTIQHSLYNALAGLGIRAQQDDHSQGETFVYGWEFGYRSADVLTVDRADEMLKTLKSINRKLDALKERFGYPGDFGDYVARCADAIGAKAIVWKRNPSSYSRDADDYRHATIAEGIAHVRATVDKWSQSHKQVAA